MTLARQGAAFAPAVADTSGLSDFDISLWQGVFVPLNVEVSKIVTQPRYHGEAAAGFLRRESAMVLVGG